VREKAMLRSIKKRVSKLEGQLGRKKSFGIIIVQPGETKEEAQERHIREHPEDRKRDNFIIISTIQGEGYIGGPPPYPGQEQPQGPYRGELSEDDKPLQITR
jgi:hypothetical protein